MSKAEKTKQYIVEMTAPVFNEKGYAGTSLTDLTEATGLSKGSIYGNFENKDEVALAAFDYNFNKISQYLREKISQHDHSIMRLKVYPEVYGRFLSIPFLKAGCPILNTATEADDTHPQLRDKVVKALDTWKSSIVNQILRGQMRKEIKSDVNAEEIAILIMSLIEGAVMQAKVTGSSHELQICMKHLSKIIDGIER